MSTDRVSSKKKRSLVAISGDSTAAHELEPPTRRMRPLESVYQAHVQSELDNLKAALEHERTLRNIDQRTAKQVQTKLERRVEFAIEEAQEAKNTLQDYRSNAEVRIAQLQEARNSAVQQLRECQEELAQAEVDAVDQHNAALAQEQVALLEEQLQHKTEQLEAMEEKLNQLSKSTELSLDQLREIKTPSKQQQEPNVSPAPEAVLRELNKSRIEKAEAERKYRQLRRKADEWHERANLYVKEREANRAASARVHQVEQELRELRKQHETARASLVGWQDFEKKLGTALKKDAFLNGPPEVATVLRHFEDFKLQIKKLEQEKKTLEKTLAEKDKRAAVAESSTKQLNDTANWDKERKELETQLASATQQVKSMRAQEGILRREADSMRSLLKTFDEGPGVAPASSATTKALQISLSSSREEVKVLTEARNDLAKELEKVREVQKEQKKEHERVVEKFGKLKEALMGERAKVEAAEGRACKAEALAGKGSFNQDESRALHLKRNPLTDAIRDRYETEIRDLQRQLQEATGEKPAAASSSHNDVDPQKLHTRLKQSFKEHIALFREGVYMLTGYKFDMTVETEEKVNYRVRSMFAEHEHDDLKFSCEKIGNEIQNPALLDTDHAKLLTQTHCYDLITKYNSIPAFMASVQLMLHEMSTEAKGYDLDIANNMEEG